MNRKRSITKSVWVAFLMLVLAIALHLHIFRRQPSSSFLYQIMYLPSGKYLQTASLGYEGILADFIYLWSIQYFGNTAINPRVEYLKHTYDLITGLDPQYLDAYQTGALFMFFEGRDPASGLALLDEGFQRNPDEWILPMDAGFYCLMNLKDYKRAATYFEKAAKLPDSGTFAKRMLAGMKFRTGEKRQAYELWREVYDTTKRPSIKQIAFQHTHDLTVLIQVEELNKASEMYHSRFQRHPLNLDQLVASGFVQRIPTDPEGNPYDYDPETGKVRYSKALKLYQRYQ